MLPDTSRTDGPLGPRDFVLYAVCVLIFGSGWLPLKLQLGVVAPEVSGTWRFLVASLAMLVFVMATGAPLAFKARDHVLFAGLGATLFSLNFLFFYYAGYHLPSGLMSVIFSLSSILIPLFSALFLRVPLRRQILFGALAGIAGTALVFGPSLADGRGINGAGEGLALGVAGTVSFAFGSLLSGVAGRRGYPMASTSFWGFAYGFLILLMVSLARGAPFMVDWSVRYLGSLGFLIVVQTLAGFAVYIQLIRRIGANRAGYGTVMFPIVALFLSTWFEDYHWTATAAAGIALVLAGNLLVLRQPKPATGA
ncbi:DMT family transporter [Xanthobacter sp. DSM 14520]|uniref:DMT family transporter n=1 Tax=Xanthobacter autotrophicus (strain ATCC BAA-1158 / Py2) TaxID=78245 RepID=UPI00372951C5